jgi:phosphoserine phosphatase
MNGYRYVATPEEVLEMLKREAVSDHLILSKNEPDLIKKMASSICHIAADFDGTITAGSQWVEIQNFLPNTLLNEEHQDRDWYYEQTSGVSDVKTDMSDPDWLHGHLMFGNQTAVEGAWVARSFARYIQANLTDVHVKMAGKAVVMRQGAVELFELMNQRVVITFGVEQIIKAFLEENKIHASIAATRLTFDKNGFINGYNRNVVVSATKAAAANRFHKLVGDPPHFFLSIGDSIVDIEMMPENGFNVLIMPPGEANKKLAAFRRNHLATMFNKLTMILVSDSLLPLVDLIRQARA